MYQPPPPAVVSLLIGQIVDTVTFCLFTIHIQFQDGDRISLACPFRFGTRESLASLDLQAFPIKASNLMRVVGTSIADVANEPDGTLSMIFSTGDQLVAYANDPAYEAYTLLINGKEYLV